MPLGTNDPKSTKNGSTKLPESTTLETESEALERKLFEGLLKVKQYPIAPDEPSFANSPEDLSAPQS